MKPNDAAQVKEIEKKAESIPNSGSVQPETKAEKKKPGRRPMTDEERARKAAEKAAGIATGAGSPGHPSKAAPIQINEMRVKQCSQILQLPANVISGVMVTYTGHSRAAMKAEEKTQICDSWAMILELYFPDWMDNPKVLALITACFVSGQYGLRCYAIKKVVNSGELQSDQIKPGNPPNNPQANSGPVENSEFKPPIVTMAPEPSPFNN